MAQDNNFVYEFRAGYADGNKDMKEKLGGKGANLAEMASIGLPVPPGFTITTDAYSKYAEDGTIPREQVIRALRTIENQVKCSFNDSKNPLLLSVRSGARVSMPGMMDTILNLGLNDKTVKGLSIATNNKRFAYDCYRRFIAMYANVVLNIEMKVFEEALQKEKEEQKNVKHDHELSVEKLEKLVRTYKSIVYARTGFAFPMDPHQQLRNAIKAVFSSWNNDRAITYRRINGIPDDWGTAVNVQAMVFGNMGDDCATGVAFTRNPITGKKEYFGEYLVNAQGEDVVSGVRTPQSINLVGEKRKLEEPRNQTFEEEMPEMYRELVSVFRKLENHYREIQDIEFTVQNKKLYILQTRNAKISTRAAVHSSVEMVREKLITKEEAILRVEPNSLNHLFHKRIDEKVQVTVLTSGNAASPGAAFGAVVFTADDAVKKSEKGQKVILVRNETSADDIQGMHKSQGILTASGGMTSHAAVVARNMGRPCVTGASELNIDMEKKLMTIKSYIVKESDLITIDGFEGLVIKGEVSLLDPEKSKEYDIFMEWVDAVRRMRVLANADTPAEVQNAIKNGAQGIGLVRTEHMFFHPERITVMHRMILAQDEYVRREALDELSKMQMADFEKIFRAMKGKQVTVRLLDPPLHEFLPNTEKEIRNVAQATGIEIERVKDIVQRHYEVNPMLGHRGCRLLISYPEICEMQARTIFASAAKASFKPQIMVPLVATREELDVVSKIVEKVASEVSGKQGERVEYTIGTMIELPAAALCADQLAKTAKFFSFGTNDLTQTTFGLSRDDTAGFIKRYIEKGIIRYDPFVTLQEKCVLKLISMACNEGRSTNPRLQLGICGEHGGDPKSIDLCERVGLNYVSCSPMRVPVARLACAQATIKHRSN